MELKQKKRLSASAVARLGIIMIFSVYPLLMTNKYYNLTDTKYTFFCFVSAICMALCLIISTIRTDFSDPKSVIERIKSKTTPSDICILLFAFVSVFSCISSDYFVAALGGGQGRQMGLIMNLALTFAYFFISKFYMLKNKDFFFLGIAFTGVCALALVQFLGFDPFGLIATLTSVRRTTFLSTIGNMNVYASYVCIVAPLAMYLSCFENDKKRMVFWHIISCIGFIALFTSNSDSGYIGIGVSFILIFIISTKNTASFKRMWILILSFFLMAGLFKALSVIFTDTMYHLTMLTKVVTSKYIVFGGIVVSATVLYILKMYYPNEKFLKTVRRISVIAVISVIVGAAIVIIYFSFINTGISLGGLENYLRFDENWGTGRGDIWIKSLKTFSELPLSKKLIGAGEDTFALLLTDRLGYSQIKIGNSFFDNAHSELIQYLLSIGIFGLASYLMLAFYAVKTALKSDSVTQNALMIPIVAFLLQSTVNILQPITSPFIFVLFALTQCKTED